jgi:branched-chain amino acid transport system permease protein
MSYLWHLLVYLEIYAVVALSLNLLIGYGGLLQVAHAGYFGVGAYTSAFFMMRLGWGFLPALGAAAVASATLSLLVSLPAWRFRADYFVMVSLAVQAGLNSAMLNWNTVTNGPYGIPGIPSPAIGDSLFATPAATFVFFLPIVAALGAAIAALQRSPFGRALQAARDDELAARSIGLSVRILKTQVFLVASATVGVSGAMYGSYVTYIDPSSFNLDESILMLSMVIVGGTGNFRGPLVGAGVLVALPEILRFLALPSGVAASVRLLVYGLLLIAMMLFRPQGLAGRYRFE